MTCFVFEAILGGRPTCGCGIGRERFSVSEEMPTLIVALVLAASSRSYFFLKCNTGGSDVNNDYCSLHEFIVLVLIVPGLVGRQGNVGTTVTNMSHSRLLLWFTFFAPCLMSVQCSQRECSLLKHTVRDMLGHKGL